MPTPLFSDLLHAHWLLPLCLSYWLLFSAHPGGLGFPGLSPLSLGRAQLIPRLLWPAGHMPVSLLRSRSLRPLGSWTRPWGCLLGPETHVSNTELAVSPPDLLLLLSLPSTHSCQEPGVHLGLPLLSSQFLLILPPKKLLNRSFLSILSHLV